MFSRTRTFVTDRAALRRNGLVWPDDAGPQLEAYRMLRTQVLQRMVANGYRTLGIVSPEEGDGRTRIACNLAISLAADEKHTVLLADFDLRRPAIGARFGIPVESGVDDVLAGRAAVDAALVHPDLCERLVLLPARAATPAAPEVLAGVAAARLAAELRERYADRLVIYDLPPVLAADDALAFAPNLDCALLVVAEGRTRRDSVLRCFEMLRELPIVGTVLVEPERRR